MDQRRMLFPHRIKPNPKQSPYHLIPLLFPAEPPLSSCRLQAIPRSSRRLSAPVSPSPESSSREPNPHPNHGWTPIPLSMANGEATARSSAPPRIDLSKVLLSTTSLRRQCMDLTEVRRLASGVCACLPNSVSSRLRLRQANTKHAHFLCRLVVSFSGACFNIEP